MTREREDLEKIEARSLAPYAQWSSASRGRQHAEEAHAHRSEYQRDRDRIVHSRAFRRLEYKTQVFLNGTGDHYRTRLTHTMEVACIARSVSRSLGLNEDLAEAIALAHDLGHPPFGHAGEVMLNSLMHQHGGFDHNHQSIRVVSELELKYPEFNGLNLSWETMEGLAKNLRPGYENSSGFAVPDSAAAQGTTWQPSLEAQVADLADDLAYVCHDLDDALEAGLITQDDLADQPLWQETVKRAHRDYSRLDSERGRAYVLRCLLDKLAGDAIQASAAAIKSSGISSVADVRSLNHKLIGVSEETWEPLLQLRRFLFNRFYLHPDIKKVNERVMLCLKQLFQLIVKHPHLLNQQFSTRIKKDGLYRATCDYLACMTDRCAMKQFEEVFGNADALAVATMEQPVLFSFDNAK
ncbi:MAG: deoxyguanosinetriphosphate triphosphohydrolase [Candidatus Methylacidiphilales bacterium]|nr:deoxyguanosinetriphosphate triphosphohydrolase [Candidatus Methylacidiphilales bacterium]